MEEQALAIVYYRAMDKTGAIVLENSKESRNCLLIWPLEIPVVPDTKELE